MADKQGLGLGNTCGRAQRSRHQAFSLQDEERHHSEAPSGVSMLEDTNISPNGEKEALTQNGPRDLIQNLSFVTTGR